MAKTKTIKSYKKLKNALDADLDVFRWGNKTFIGNDMCYAEDYDKDDNPIIKFFMDYDTFWIEDGRICICSSYCEQADSEENLNRKISHNPEELGIAIGKQLVFDADGYVAEGVEHNIAQYGFKQTSVSFNLLGRLLGMQANTYGTLLQLKTKDLEAVKDMFLDGSIKVLEGTQDEYYTLTKKATSETVANKEREGFTATNALSRALDQKREDLSGLKMHRSGTVLVQHEDKRFLMGFDDRQYFGVELPATSTAKNLKEAYRDLQPPEVQESNEYLRQGEWFVVEMGDGFPARRPQENFMRPLGCCAEQSGLEWVLPKHDSDSNDHRLNAKLMIVGDRILAQGPGQLSHSQHSTILLDADTWYQIVENTAVQSLSQEGVD